jgi:DNA-binding NarL/FixJ family response regulator
VIRVLIADDQSLVSAGLRAILEDQDDIEVVGEAADGAQAVELVRRYQPDVVLMDVRMPVMDGIRATELIVRWPATSRVLILTTFDLDEYVYAALKAGASGFLLKDVPRDQIVSGVRTVAAGESLLAPAVTRRLIERFMAAPQQRAPSPRMARLTERETEVLRLIARGLSNAEIAEELVLSSTTIKTHVASILRKLELRDRVQAVVAAFENGVAAH